ncbi:MAG: cbb3-type cytochrome oxidase assembly protein CcoS [Candidatus Kapaibacterium sp.]
MAIGLVLIVASVVVAALFLAAFIWAAKSGQYDDLRTPAVRMLFPERIVTKDLRNISVSDQSDKSDG